MKSDSYEDLEANLISFLTEVYKRKMEMAATDQKVKLKEFYIYKF